MNLQVRDEMWAFVLLYNIAVLYIGVHNNFMAAD